jgi:hypothetical protein
VLTPCTTAQCEGVASSRSSTRTSSSFSATRRTNRSRWRRTSRLAERCGRRCGRSSRRGEDANGLRVATWRQRQARHERLELRAQAIPTRAKNAGAWAQLEDHRANAGLRGRTDYRRERPRPRRPIFAIRPGGHGDIRRLLTTTRATSWPGARRAAGPMPTPLIYRGLVYVRETRSLRRGADRPRNLPSPSRAPGAASARRQCADDRIYLPSEDGTSSSCAAASVQAPRDQFNGRASDGDTRSHRSTHVNQRLEAPDCSRTALNRRSGDRRSGGRL